jgi:hypothetical protein
MPKPEFKKIRTMTMTKTYVETLFEALKRLRDCRNTPEEKAKIEKLIKLIDSTLDDSEPLCCDRYKPFVYKEPSREPSSYLHHTPKSINIRVRIKKRRA